MKVSLAFAAACPACKPVASKSLPSRRFADRAGSPKRVFSGKGRAVKYVRVMI